MKHFGIINSDGWLDGVTTANDDAPEDDPALTLLPNWTVWPTPPAPGLRLRQVNGSLIWQDPRTLEQVRSAHWAALKAARAAKDYAPITIDGIELDTADASRMDFMGAIMSMQITGQASRPWRCSDNTMRDLTLAQIMSAGIGIADRRSALIGVSDVLYQQVNAAQSIADVLAIEWPAEP
jgi:hypothetical protein